MSEILDQVVAELAAAAGVPADLIDADRTFAAQGLAADEVRRAAEALSARMETAVPDLFWACATPATLADHLGKQEYDADGLVMRLGFRRGLPDEVYYE